MNLLRRTKYGVHQIWIRRQKRMKGMGLNTAFVVEYAGADNEVTLSTSFFYF